MYISKNSKAAVVALTVVIAGCSEQEPFDQNQNLFTTVTSTQSEIFQASDNTVWIDVRSPDSFNGWLVKDGQLQSGVGGHIPGAQLLSASWIEQGLNDLDRAWERTGVTAEQKVVLYGDTPAQTSQVASWLVDEQKMAASNIALLTDSFTELQSAYKETTDQNLDYLPGYKSLVPPAYVASSIKNPKPAIIIQIGWDGGKGTHYRAEHIPGALFWDDMEFEFPPIYEAHSADIIRSSLAQIGIDKNTSVIVYSTDSIGAARGAVIMKYAGVDDVVMMNGGLAAWKAAGFDVESGWQEPVPVNEFGLTGAGDSAVMVDIEQAAEIRTPDNSALVSIRAWKEFSGEVSGYSYFSKRGRIPGALWGHAGDSSWDMNHFHNPDNTMRNYHQIASFWDEWGIRPDMTLSFYCGSGWRASEAWWYAQAMGFERTTVYSSGWMRWSEDDRAVATGEPTKEQMLNEWQVVQELQGLPRLNNSQEKTSHVVSTN